MSAQLNSVRVPLVRNFVDGVRRFDFSGAPFLFGMFALLFMSACSSRNPDALGSPNTEQSQPDLNDAMNAIAAAPANSVDNVSSQPAGQASAAPEETSPKAAPTPPREGASRRIAADTVTAAENVNADSSPDTQEDSSVAPPEEPTNSD
jgi:hypothetical protein